MDQFRKCLASLWARDLSSQDHAPHGMRSRIRPVVATRFKHRSVSAPRAAVAEAWALDLMAHMPEAEPSVEIRIAAPKSAKAAATRHLDWLPVAPLTEAHTSSLYDIWASPLPSPHVRDKGVGEEKLHPGDTASATERSAEGGDY